MGIKSVWWFTRECSWISCLWTSPTSLSGTQGELVVGDSGGSLTIYKSIGAPTSRRKILYFSKIEKKRKFRENAISHIIQIAGHNLLITCAYDNTGELLF